MVAVERRTSGCAPSSRSATQPRWPVRADCWRRSAAAMWLPSGRPTPSGLPHSRPTSRSFFFLCLTYCDAAVVSAARGQGAGDAASVCGGGVGCLRPGGTRQVADQRRARRLNLGGCSTLVVVGGWWRRRDCPRAGRRPRRGGGNCRRRVVVGVFCLLSLAGVLLPSAGGLTLGHPPERLVGHIGRVWCHAFVVQQLEVAVWSRSGGGRPRASSQGGACVAAFAKKDRGIPVMWIPHQKA